MFKKQKHNILIILLLIGFLAFNCKSAPEEETTNEEDTTQTTQNNQSDNDQEGTQTDVDRKISEEEFLEAQELINRAKNAEADIYDPDNYQGAVDDLQKARD
ncbi:MAG: hypothetical protein MJB14_01045, partial [Spirochaetes bacterium]|nr:hypothetical protein [Spirochaetota bacterium]